MNNTVPLEVIDGIIDALNGTLEQNRAQGILNVPLFSGITKGSITKTQGRTFGAIMQNADCYQYISKLSTRRDQAKIASGLTKLVNEVEAGRKWMSEAESMLAEISSKEVQHVPVYSDVKGQDEVEISFAALDSEQVDKLEKTLAAGEKKLEMMEQDVRRLTGETRVEISSHERKKLRTLIPGFEHTFPIAIAIRG